MPVCLAAGKKKQQLTFWVLAENWSHLEFSTSATGFPYHLWEDVGGSWGLNQRLRCTNLNI